MEDSSSQQSYSFLRIQWEGFKEFWLERFSFLGNYSKFVRREPIPTWSNSDVDDFIASNPVHGHSDRLLLLFSWKFVWLRTAREAMNYDLTGSVLGAVSKSLHGADLSFLAGGVFGWAFGHEIANHSLQLYRLDTGCVDQAFGIVGKEGRRAVLKRFVVTIAAKLREVSSVANVMVFK